MPHTFSHFGPRITLIREDERPITVDTWHISEALELRDTLNAAINAAHDAAEAEAEANREKFSLELGVILNGERKCALEAGPFDTSADAVGFAFEMRGKFAFQVKALSEHNTEYFDVGPDDLEATLPIIGATLNIFTDADGTIRNIDLY